MIRLQICTAGSLVAIGNARRPFSPRDFEIGIAKNEADEQVEGLDCPHTPKTYVAQTTKKLTMPPKTQHTGTMDNNHEALMRFISILEKQAELLRCASTAVTGIISTDETIKKVLDPNNECAHFEEPPLTWEELLEKGVRENYFKRKFRFEPE